MKSIKNNLKALALVESMIMSKDKFVRRRLKVLGDDKFDRIYGEWDTESFYQLRNLFFELITGEPDFDEFYDSFDAPATAKGNKPIAWGREVQKDKRFAKFFKNGKNEHIVRFLPDQIDDVVWDTSLPLKKKVSEIKTIYDMCKQLKKLHRKGK